MRRGIGKPPFKAESTDAAEEKEYRKNRRGRELLAELVLRESRLKKIREARKAPDAEAKTAVEEERIFGFIKRGLGFTQFLLNGTEKMCGEWRLVCMACNLRKL